MSKKKKKQESNKIAIFEDKEIRRITIDGEWYFSVIDIIGVLSESSTPKRYWSDLKIQLESNGFQPYENIVQLKLLAKDGKKRITDVADTETMFRIIQSIPSKKAEPFKRWLARIGKERLDEIEQPAKAIERAKGYYVAKGHNPEWIQTRTVGIETRNSFTDTLQESGIKEKYEYAILTDEMYKSWAEFNTYEYKKHKNLTKNDSLRDNMTPLELATVIFNEATTTEILKETNADGFVETRKAVHIAGNITKEAIKKIEKQTGKKVVTHKNYKELDSPEIRKELAQQSAPKELNKGKKPIKKLLNPFDKKLKGLLNVPPEKD